MTTFLATYASSIKINTTKISENWIKASKKIFGNIRVKDSKNTFYDKLIMDCVFKEPLMSHQADFASGCISFDYSLTSNGLCHTFNGIETSLLLKQKWRFTEVNKAFERIFEKSFGGKRTFV